MKRSATGLDPRLILYPALALFLGVLAYNFALLESDRLPTFMNGTSFGDEVAWAHSARMRFLHGTWFRPLLDDWRPIFLVPLHSILVWLGFEGFGLTLTGLRLHAFFFVTLAKMAICCLAWREHKKTSHLVLALLVVSLLPPLNEMSRTGALDSTQAGLLALSVLLMITARDGQSRLRYLLGGAACGLVFCYKLSAFLWPLFPYVFLHLRWRLSLEPEPGPPWRPWARRLMLYLPCAYLLVDACLLKSDRSYNLGLVLWPLLPLAYLALDLGLTAHGDWRAGRRRRGWGLACWLAMVLAWGSVLAAKALSASPGQALVMLRNLLPLILGLGFVHATWLRHGWRGLACGDPRALAWSHLGLGLTLGLAAALWIIPHLDGAIYFSWRMFGTSGRLMLPAHSREIALNFLDILNIKVGGAQAMPTVMVHSAWVFGILAGVMLCALKRRQDIGDLDLALAAGAGIFFGQCVVYDMSWHRYYGLMPLGYLGLAQLASAAANWRDWPMRAQAKPLAWLAFAYCFYLLAARLVYPVPFGRAAHWFWLPAGLMLAGGAVYWLILRRQARLVLLALLLPAAMVLPANAKIAWRYFGDVTHSVREASLELGRKLGAARTPGFYELSLYNRTEAGYIGNFRGQVKPDGFFWEGKHVDSLYKAVEARRGQDAKARLFWALDGFYPGFLKAWELPPDYRQRYNSDWLLETPDRLSPRHLIIGASEPVVYVQKAAYDFYFSRSRVAPALTGEEITVPTPRHMLEESAMAGGDASGEKVIRLLRLDPSRRIPGGLGKISLDNPGVDAVGDSR